MKNKNCEQKILYKYRSLQDFKRLLDILINSRLYASPYSKLNDIREGIYSHNGSMSEIKIDAIRRNKEQLKICSLSSNSNSPTMWTNYADNHEGVCLEIEIIDERVTCKEVVYGSILKNVQTFDAVTEKKVAEEILTCKEECWKCEEEIRVFKKGKPSKKTFVKVCVKKIILGKRITLENKNLIEKLCIKIDPNKRIQIEVSQ